VAAEVDAPAPDVKPGELQCGNELIRERHYWEAAPALMQEMESYSLTLDVVSYSAASCACEKGKEWHLALQLLREMIHQHLAPNMATLDMAVTAAVSACDNSLKKHAPLTELLDSMCPRGQVIEAGHPSNLRDGREGGHILKPTVPTIHAESGQSGLSSPLVSFELLGLFVVHKPQG